MAYQDLRKNPADKRLAFVWPSLDNEQKLTVLDVVFNAIGIDDWRQELDFEPDDGDEVLGHFADRLAVNTIVDAYIPWLAKVVKRGVTGGEEDALKRRFLSICMWAQKTNTDLSRVSLADALESARSHITKAGRKGKVESDANPVVYRFDDGFKIVQLKTDAALKLEGTLLKHCVGTYCDQVREGTSVIYSLRTPSNEPLVTLEYQPENKSFEQMFGMENSGPEPHVIPYLIEFVEKKFPHDIKGLLLAGKLAKDIDFSGADLEGTSLYGANLEGAALTNANLIGADLTRANLVDANLKGADLTNAKLKGANLEGADLRGANLDDVNLEGANLKDADLKGADVMGGLLGSAKLEGANLRGANLTSAVLINADLTYAKLEGAILKNAELQYADLSDADLSEAILSYAILSNAKLHGTIIRGANLEGASLEGANLRDADLYGAVLRYADLEGADLEDANLTGANLKGAKLEGVKYNDRTIWPEGFTPPANAVTASADDDYEPPADMWEALDLAKDGYLKQEELEKLKADIKKYPNFKVWGEVLEDTFLVDDKVITIDDDDFSVQDPEEWVSDQMESYNGPGIKDKVEELLVEKFNNDFQKYPGTLFHSTPNKNLEAIMKRGLKAESQTRGLTNRGVGAAIFTYDNEESTMTGSYGDTVLAIDCEAMKRDGLEFYVEQEPAVTENETAGILASAVGADNFNWEAGGDGADDPATVILHIGVVPPKYLRVVSAP